METTRIDVHAEDVLRIHKEGVKTGFFAGVIFCIAVKHLHTRRKAYADALFRERQAKIP